MVGFSVVRACMSYSFSHRVNINNLIDFPFGFFVIGREGGGAR